MMDTDPEPLGPTWRRRLRRAVVEHARTAGRSERPVLHVGEPGGPTLSIDVDGCEPSDPGLRTDLVAALVAEVGRASAEQPLVWLSRSGDLSLQDIDSDWLAATRGAAEESGRALVMVVVNRRGWHDPRSGRSRTWARLRHTPTSTG